MSRRGTDCSMSMSELETAEARKSSPSVALSELERAIPSSSLSGLCPQGIATYATRRTVVTTTRWLCRVLVHAQPTAIPRLPHFPRPRESRRTEFSVRPSKAFAVDSPKTRRWGRSVERLRKQAARRAGFRRLSSAADVETNSPDTKGTREGVREAAQRTSLPIPLLCLDSRELLTPMGCRAAAERSRLVTANATLPLALVGRPVTHESTAIGAPIHTALSHAFELPAPPMLPGNLGSGLPQPTSCRFSRQRDCFAVVQNSACWSALASGMLRK